MQAVAACDRGEGLDWLIVLIRMWRENDHPRALAVVHHICSMILASPQASSHLKDVYVLAHLVMWPTVADALHDADDLDPDELSAYPQNLIVNDFSSSSWLSLAPCTDGENILANLDAACGILGSVGTDCLSKLEIMPFDSAEGVIRQMADIKAGSCIAHFLLWCRLSAAIATGDVRLFLLETTSSQDKAAVLVAPSLKHVESCFNMAIARVKGSSSAGDVEPSVLLLLDFIVADSGLEVHLYSARHFVVPTHFVPSQGNVKDVVEAILMANFKILSGIIEEVCAFDPVPFVISSNRRSICML